MNGLQWQEYTIVRWRLFYETKKHIEQLTILLSSTLFYLYQNEPLLMSTSDYCLGMSVS